MSAPSTTPLVLRSAGDNTGHADDRLACQPQPADPDTCCMEVSSTVLLQGRKTVAITHNGSTYRLQATRLGKLILTK